MQKERNGNLSVGVISHGLRAKLFFATASKTQPSNPMTHRHAPEANHGVLTLVVGCFSISWNGGRPGIALSRAIILRHFYILVTAPEGISVQPSATNLDARRLLGTSVLSRILSKIVKVFDKYAQLLSPSGVGRSPIRGCDHSCATGKPETIFAARVTAQRARWTFFRTAPNLIALNRS